jgi:hypothetical protein
MPLSPLTQPELALILAFRDAVHRILPEPRERDHKKIMAAVACVIGDCSLEAGTTKAARVDRVVECLELVIAALGVPLQVQRLN